MFVGKPTVGSEVRSYSRRAVLIGVGGIGVTALAGCLTSGDGDDWPMSRATAESTGYTSASGPVGALATDWEWPFDPGEVRNTTSSAPAVGDAVPSTCDVVLGTGIGFERSSHLVALEADTGDEHDGYVDGITAPSDRLTVRDDRGVYSSSGRARVTPVAAERDDLSSSSSPRRRRFLRLLHLEDRRVKPDRSIGHKR